MLTRVVAFVSALLVLAALDALPGPPLALRSVVLALTVQDVAVLSLATLLGLSASRREWRTLLGGRVGRLTGLLAAALLAWLLFRIVGTNSEAGTPLRKAALAGRDFLFFGLVLLPLAARLTNRAFRNSFWPPLLIMACVQAALVPVVVVAGQDFSFVVHPAGVLDEGSNINRIYLYADQLIVLSFFWLVAISLHADSKRSRWGASMGASLLLVALVSLYTRAIYLGLAVGLLVIVVASVIRAFSGVRSGSMRGAVALVSTSVGVLALAAVAAVAIGATQQLSAFVDRAATIFSAAGSNDPSVSTVAYRVQLVDQYQQLIGSRWLAGVGFLSPDTNYVAGLPRGTLRNGDVGVFNAIATMGVIGAALIFLPLALLFGGALQTLREPRRPTFRSISGTASIGWIAFALVTSPTLVLLFNEPGLVVAAIGLAGGVSGLSSSRAGDVGVPLETFRRRAPPA